LSNIFLTASVHEHVAVVFKGAATKLRLDLIKAVAVQMLQQLHGKAEAVTQT